MNNNAFTTSKERKDIKEEMYGERLARKEMQHRRERTRTMQDDVLDSLITQAKELATKHFSILNTEKEKNITEILREDYIRLIEVEHMDCLKAYSIVKLAETMLSEVSRHFILVSLK